MPVFVAGPAIAVMRMRRELLIALFKLNGATSPENAVTIQEIYENKNWRMQWGIPPIRRRAIYMDVKLLCRRGILKKTDSERYYLFNDDMRSMFRPRFLAKK